jgi:putative phosphoesterase
LREDRSPPEDGFVRIAIVSDIHGNLTALEAVIADLRETSPDLILHGGDLAAGGARPVEVIDRIRSLSWQGALGNTDEMLYRPAALTEFASRAPHLKTLFDAIAEMAEFTREALGAERLAWLESLPAKQSAASIAFVHASPASLWVAPGANATEDELQTTYRELDQPLTVYAHIHHPYIRRIGERTFANTGSVSLSYDGDPRASYLLVDENAPTIRRVPYDLAAETKSLAASGIPHAGWVARSLQQASFLMP